MFSARTALVIMHFITITSAFRSGLLFGLDGRPGPSFFVRKAAYFLQKSIDYFV